MVLAERYRLEALLGRGGSAAVYRAVDLLDGRALAVKRLVGSDAPALDARRRLRFRREFHTLSGLNHPNIVDVHDFGIDERPFYTMELLDGADLADARPMPFAEVCRLLRDVASALAYLHARRLVHRDLSPNNVRCTSDGRAKLFDFGLLAVSGGLGSPAGTPPSMAPEALRNQVVDHRADLFGLGALAYFLLTGQHAFPARELDQLEAVWKRGVRPPSQLVFEVPPALDELVISLLSIEPLGRPGSTAEVIDRLGGIGRLAPLPAVEAVRGTLASAALVGRRPQLERLTRAVKRLRRTQRGSAFLLEAVRGMGRSRLLRDVAVQAQLAGLASAFVEPVEREQGPYQAARALVRSLLSGVPKLARAALTPGRAALLGAVVPELQMLGGRRGRISLVEPDAARQRARVQREMVAWLLDIARERPLALVIDDLQACDEASAALFASLAHHARNGAPLVVVAALRSGEPPQSIAAVQSITSCATRLALSGLTLEDVRELLRSHFGESRGLEALASWLHDTSAGNPLECSELLRHLVDRGVLTYADGAWQIHALAAEERLPRAWVSALRARVEGLDALARRLVEVLAVHGREVDLELCLRLVDGDENGLFAALDRLLQRELLVGADDRLRFRQDALRQVIYDGLPTARRRELHRELGRALAASAGNADHEPARAAQIGWHLLEGGEDRAAAEFLERAGTAFFNSEAAADAIPPLEAALAVYEREGRYAYRCMVMREMLVRCGLLCDRQVALRYGDESVAQLDVASGLSLARRLSFLGRLPALILAQLWRSMLWVLCFCRGPAPLTVMIIEYRILGYLAAVKAGSFDFQGVRELMWRMEPVALALRGRAPYLAYLYCSAMVASVTGRLGEALETARRFFEISDKGKDKLTPLYDRELSQGAMRFLVALIGAVRQDPDCLRQLDRIENDGIGMLVASARLARGLYHRMRGEEELALRYEEETRLLYLQLGTACLIEVQRGWITAMGYAASRDVSGLKRSIADLEKLVAEGCKLESYLTLTKAEYHRERGQLARARQELEELLAGDCGENRVLRRAAYSALSTTLILLGEHQQAVHCAREAVSLASDAIMLPVQLRAQRCLAVAEAEAGDLPAGARRLDALLDEPLPFGPQARGALHEARARIAWQQGDVATYRRHLEHTERWFRGTGNAALAARCEHLAALGARGRLVSLPPTDLSASDDACNTRGSTRAVTGEEGPTRELGRPAARTHDQHTQQRACPRLRPLPSAS